MWTEMNLGSNIFTNVPGVILVESEGGLRQLMALEVGERSQHVLLTIDVYDADRKHVAKLVRNAWVFNDRDRFDVTTAPQSLKLIEKASGRVVVEANVLDASRVQVLNGDLYTPTGQHIEVTESAVVIDESIRLEHNKMISAGQGAGIVIGRFSFSFGAALGGQS